MTAISYHVQLTLARIPNPNHGRGSWNQSALSGCGLSGASLGDHVTANPNPKSNPNRRSRDI